MHIARKKKKIILSERKELLKLYQEWRTRVARLKMSVLKVLGKQEKSWRIHADVINGKVSLIDNLDCTSIISGNKIIK